MDRFHGIISKILNIVDQKIHTLERKYFMVKYYSKKDFKNLVNAITDATQHFRLVVFVGAGISLSQGYPNWDGYVEKMIHYWQFNIQKYTVPEIKIDNNLLSQFDQILKFEGSNKRKIDLLDTLLKKTLGSKYDELQLDFEKYFFEQVNPNTPEIEILMELVKLDPIFITSNYDFEIERHIRRAKQEKNFHTINNIHEFTVSGLVLQPNDILHLHGTTSGDPNYFINSSLDYSRQYLNNSLELNNLKKWFKEKQPIVLFIGSSMEEDEILSLLPDTSKNFALMKANSRQTEEFRDLFNQTFIEKYKTNIFWFGDKYSDLTKQIKKIVNAVQEQRDVPEDISDWYTLHTLSLKSRAFKETFEKHSDDNSFLSGMFQVTDCGLQQRILVSTLQSTLLLSKAVYINNFWAILNTHLKKINVDKLQNLIEILKTKELNYNITFAYTVFQKLKEATGVQRQDINTIQKKISLYPDVLRTPFSNDKKIVALCLIEGLKQTIFTINEIPYTENEITIELDDSDLLEIISSTEKQVIYKYLSFKELIKSYETINIIYKSLTKDKIFLNDISILQNYPPSLLKIRLFQRMLVNLDNGKNLENTILNQLVEEIDFSDHSFGEELNYFVKKHQNLIEQKNIKIQKKYIDGIGETESGSVTEMSFINASQLIEENDDKLLSRLNNSNKSHTDSENIWVEKTFEATSKYILNALKNETMVSKKLTNLIETYGTLLYPNYESLFVDIIIDNTYSSDLKKLSKNIILDSFNFDNFSSESYRLFKMLTEQNQLEELFFDKLSRVNINKLKYISPYQNKPQPQMIETIYFINTELGRYLDTLISWCKKDKSKSNTINNIVSNLNNERFREFTEGAFFAMKLIDISNLTINNFQGYSYILRGIQNNDLDKFLSAGKILLKNGFVNNSNQSNLFFLTLKKINPSNFQDQVQWASINFTCLVNIVLSSDITLEYENSWIQKIILNDHAGKNMQSVLYSISKEESLERKVQKVFDLIKDVIEKYSGKVDITQLSHYIKKTTNSARKSMLCKFFFLLLDEDKVKRSYIGGKTIIDIMQELPTELQERLVQHHNLPSVVSPLEIEELKRLAE